MAHIALALCQEKEKVNICSFNYTKDAKEHELMNLITLFEMNQHKTNTLSFSQYKRRKKKKKLAESFLYISSLFLKYRFIIFHSIEVIQLT